MKSFLLTILALTLGFSAGAHKPYSVAPDEQTGGLVFKGPITLADLNGEPAFKWMKQGQSQYKPDAAEIALLAKRLPGHRFVIFMGTWCDDSQNLVPKLAKVLQELNFPESQISIWGVDRAKQSNGIDTKAYNIKLVPTIILYEGEKETGRIVESVHKSIEADLAAMLRP